MACYPAEISLHAESPADAAGPAYPPGISQPRWPP